VAQIAAGEVVERPASVVKELVENALDAGATRISVEVKGGGVDLIRVTDNGSGIPSDQVALAFERHATSKINSPRDLHNINSLGFRGEALPSIAAVAGVEVVTGADGEAAGTYISLEGGDVISQKKQSRTRGTTVTVRQLFKRVPARLKFLKSAATENGRIAEVVSQYALACPGVAFTLTADDREKLRSTGRGRLLDSIIDVYGAALADRMLPVTGGPDGNVDPDIRVTGMVGSPELGRAGRGNLSFFVNRRWVSSRLLAYAVEEAYRGLLMTGKHPVAVLNIDLPPGEVDVNIHPAKSEVKFRNDGDVFRAVQRAVRRALVAQAPVPRIEEVAAAYRAPAARGETLWPVEPRESPAPPPEPPPALLSTLPVLRVVGQVMNAYIVAEGPDGLYVIDQHAAHERIRFERVREQRERQKPEVQGLLEPATYEVTPRQDAVMRDGIDTLAGFGFALEPFGERAYLVRAVPAMVGSDWSSMLPELLDGLAGEERSRWEERIVASIACHGAVRSGQALSHDEMRALVRDLEKCASPHTCPHGRPTIIRLSSTQLEREFGRG
ncbi:MAG TPA: DNA mismatch repair endonuclease MutL, partial [Dehalococcoidales bacterium]|nr:DNA mismatch repair endonuclease MutL [Dehalococcoidales bacterium]